MQVQAQLPELRVCISQVPPPDLFQSFVVLSTTATLKVMPPILLCWPMTSEEDVGGMTVEGKPSQQYSITFCCHVTDSRRGTV